MISRQIVFLVVISNKLEIEKLYFEWWNVFGHRHIYNQFVIYNQFESENAAKWPKRGVFLLNLPANYRFPFRKYETESR